MESKLGYHRSDHGSDILDNAPRPGSSGRFFAVFALKVHRESLRNVGAMTDSWNETFISVRDDWPLRE